MRGTLPAMSGASDHENVIGQELTYSAALCIIAPLSHLGCVRRLAVDRLPAQGISACDTTATNLEGFEMSVRLRQELERKIAGQVIDDLLEAGFSVTANDGEADTLTQSRDRAAILGALFSTDEDLLFAHMPIVRLDNSRTYDARVHGWVRFIWGNDGSDCINDYTTNLEGVLEHSHALCDYYSA